MSYIAFPVFESLLGKRRFLPQKNKDGKMGHTAGIIGGLAPQSTSLFYDTITQLCLQQQRPAMPRLLVNSVNTWAVTDLLAQKDMDGLFLFLRKEIGLIHKHIDFLVMACNSVHAVLEPLRAVFNFPILAIHEEVCREVALSGLQKVGVLGTKTTIDHGFYRTELAHYGIDCGIQTPDRLLELDRLIFDELIKGKGLGRVKQCLLNGVEDLREQGCKGVILACTELPLFLAQEDTDMPLFLSTQLLAKGVVERCFSKYT